MWWAIDDEAQDRAVRLSVDDEQSKTVTQIQVIMSCISRWAVYSHDSSYIYIIYKESISSSDVQLWWLNSHNFWWDNVSELICRFCKFDWCMIHWTARQIH